MHSHSIGPLLIGSIVKLSIQAFSARTFFPLGDIEW